MTTTHEDIAKLAQSWVEDFYPWLKWDDLHYQLQDQIWDAAKQLYRHARNVERRMANEGTGTNA